MNKAECIIPLPDEGVEDSGPYYRSGCFVVGVLLFITVCGIPATVGAFAAESPSDRTGAIIVASVLETIALLGWALLLRKRGSKVVPHGTDVLRNVLGFAIEQNLYEVGLAAFCRPDDVVSGQSSSFFLFIQNYASRRRTIELTLPRHEWLGSLSERQICILLTPGQAAVYRESFAVTGRPGNGIIKCRAKVRFVSGQGTRLIPRNAKESSFYIARNTRLSFPLEVQSGSPAIAEEVADPVDPACLSLYVPGMSEPRFEILRQLTESDPTTPISPA